MESSRLRGSLSDSSLDSVGRNSKTGTTNSSQGQTQWGPRTIRNLLCISSSHGSPSTASKGGGCMSRSRFHSLSLRGCQAHTFFKGAPAPFLTVSKVCNGALKLSCLCRGGEHARHRVTLNAMTALPVGVITLFFKWAHWGSLGLSDMPKVTQMLWLWTLLQLWNLTLKHPPSPTEVPTTKHWRATAR